MFRMFPFLVLALFVAEASAQTASDRQVWLDVDHDGLLDLYITAPGRDDVLLRNAGDGTFVDLTQRAGLEGRRSHSVQTGDFDRDGLEDLLTVTRSGELQLFQGQEGGAFVHLEGELEVAETARAEWIDYDRDGWDDLQTETELGETVLYHNLQGLSFERVELGLEAPAALTGGVAVVAGADAPEEPAALDRAPELGGRAPVTGRAGGGRQRLRAPTGGPPSVGGGTEEIQIDLTCAETIRDASNRPDCFQASSAPTLGMLYPLSQDLFVDPSGNVGIGTTTPLVRLDVDGAFRANGGRISTYDSPNVGTSVNIASIEEGVRASIHSGANGGSSYVRFSRPDFSIGANMTSGTATTGAALYLANEDGDSGVSLEASGQSGRLLLHNREGANAHVGVSLEARTSNGGELLLRNNLGQTSLSLRANNGGTPSNTGRLAIVQHDGVTAFQIENSSIVGRSNGAETFQLNRHTGDVTQASNATGMVKAACRVLDFGFVTDQFNNLPGGGAITATRVSTGHYNVDFGTDVSSRFVVVTGEQSSVVTLNIVNSGQDPNVVSVTGFDVLNDVPRNSDFSLVVF